MTTPTDFRALCSEVIFVWSRSTNPDDLHENMIPLVDRARAALAEPEPEGPTDEEWDAIKDRLWEQYETVGYQGERFMYDADFYTALDVARQEITRYARPAIEPVPVSERLPGEGDCTAQGWCWVLYRNFATWTLEPPLGQDGKHTGYTHWLPHHALPLPTPTP